MMVSSVATVHFLLHIFLVFEWRISEAESVQNGGWITEDDSPVIDEGPCNIEQHDAGSLTQQEFVSRYAYGEPVIITDFDNSHFRDVCAKQNLLNEWGDVDVVLSSANTYSYKKVPSTFGGYVRDYLRPQNLNKLGNETLYLFGDIDQTLWKPLLDQYTQPPWRVPKHEPALSFGLAGAGTGVPFHFHGPGFGEVIYGMKRWFLYPFDRRPAFNPDNSTLEWFLHDYPKLSATDRPLECTLKPGQVIYFPDRWWHATLNLETSLFISTFLSP